MCRAGVRRARVGVDAKRAGPAALEVGMCHRMGQNLHIATIHAA